MCAARVLSDHFERVTLIERDELPEGAAHRKGVPQSRHPHGLLDRGRRELTALFPGFDDSMRQRGGLDLDAALELAILNPEGWAHAPAHRASDVDRQPAADRVGDSRPRQEKSARQICRRDRSYGVGVGAGRHVARDRGRDAKGW